MVEPSFEESIGFVARCMKNFGLRSLHIVNPIATLTAKGRMRGGHAQEVLDSATIDSSLPKALEGLDLSIATTAQTAHSPTNLLRKPMTPRELGNLLEGVGGSVGLVFGREGTGLTNYEISCCDIVVTIPSNAEYPTLNLSHAAAIIFYELFQASSVAFDDKLAGRAVKDTILGFLSETLTRTGVEECRVGLTVRALRNVLGRSALRWREGSLLAGAFYRIAASLATCENVDASVSVTRRTRIPLGG